MAKKKRRGGKGRFRSKRAISAQIGLGSLINKARKNESFRNDPAQPSSVIKDMPDKFKDFISRNLRDDGSMNSAAQAIFDFYDDGRSEFQRELNRNIQSNPQFAKAYADRFPKTALAMKGLPMIFKAAGSAIAPGFGLATEMFKGAKAKASDVGTTLRESFAPTFAGIKELFSPDLGRGPEPLTRDQNTANIEAMNLAALDVGRDDDIFTGPAVQTGFTAPTNVSTLPSANRNFERIFALPQGTPPISPNMLGNYLVNDPGGFLRMANLPVSTTRGFAEGGIASLQDPNYNLLMEASDFSL